MPRKKGKDARTEGLSSITVDLVEDPSLSYERVLDVLASILIENAENDGTIAPTDSKPADRAA